MKRLLFLSHGTKGDLYPFLGMAVEMKRRGFRPVILTTEAHREDCEAAGCEFTSIQPKADYYAMLKHPDAALPLKSLRLYLRQAIAASTEQAYREIEKWAAKEDCAIVHNNLMFAAHLAREKLGLATASVYLHPFSHVSLIDPARDTPLNTALMSWIGRPGRSWVMRALEAQFNADLAPVQDLRLRLGLKPAANMMGDLRNDSPLKINLWPEWYCPPKPDWPENMRYAGFVDYDGPVKAGSLSEDLLTFLMKKPIVFTLGTRVLKGFEPQIELFSRACLAAGRPGLLVASAPMRSPSGDFMITGPVPFGQIFPQASAIVSHGGIGTLARAMRAGKAQLVIPSADDQFDNAYHIERLGLGFGIPASRLTLKRLTHALSQLTSTEISLTCEIAARKLAAQPGLDLACDILQSEFSELYRLRA